MTTKNRTVKEDPLTVKLERAAGTGVCFSENAAMSTEILLLLSEQERCAAWTFTFKDISAKFPFSDFLICTVSGFDRSREKKNK